MRRGVRGGFRPAFEVQLGSLVGDALWAAPGLAGVGLVMRLEALRTPVALGVDAPTWTDYAAFFAGFMAASVAWMVFCAAAADRCSSGPERSGRG